MKTWGVAKKGGKGSGNFDHSGRPGKVGGSSNRANVSKIDNQKIINDIADHQRDLPEKAMVEAQKIIGNGELSFIIEHSGDLIHRMSEYATYDSGGYAYVKEKVDKLIPALKQSSLSGEIARQRDSRRKLMEGQGIDNFDDLYYGSLRKYVEEHLKIKPVNRPQLLANLIATNVGSMNFSDALARLYELRNLLNKGKDAWVEAVHEVSESRKGGAGSGHFQHAGRPGKIGGSMPFGSSRNWVQPKDVKKKLVVNGKEASDEWVKKIKKLLDGQGDAGRKVLERTKKIIVYSKDGDSDAANEFNEFYSRIAKDKTERARKSYEEYMEAKKNGQEKNLHPDAINSALAYESILKDIPDMDLDRCDAKITDAMKRYPTMGNIAGFITLDNEIVLKVSRDNKCFNEEVAFNPFSKEIISREENNGEYFLDFDDVFIHESGHILHLANPKLWDDSYYLYYGSEHFDRSTPYSRKNSKEGFAETYVAYWKNGGASSIETSTELRSEFWTILATIEGLK